MEARSVFTAPDADVRDKFEAWKPLKQSYIQFVIQQVISIVTIVGPRPPGSPSEKEAQELILRELSKYTDEARFEGFEVHPHTLMGWVVLDAFLVIPAVFFYNFQFRLLSFILTFLGVIIFIFEFIMYKEFVDWLFPKKLSRNVIGVIKPRGPVKRRAIFNGHCDSNWEWWFNYLGGGHLLAATVAIGIIGMIIFFLLQIFFWTEFRNWIATFQVCYLPLYMLLMFFTNWNQVAPGANDNLTGVFCAMSVAKFMKDNGITLENTEVQIVLTGCEECGLRGAKDYVKRHIDHIETAFFCFDTLRDLSDMAVYSRDLTGTVQNDLRVCSIMKRAGELGGLDLEYKTVYFGASDAAAITQGGMPAATFAAMDPTPAAYYHTRNDDIDNMEPQAIGHGLDVAIGSLFIFDKEGLNGPSE